MERIKIITDSTADLPQDVVQELGIVIVPLIITFGQRSYEETGLTHDEFWRLVKEYGAPTTSQAPPGVYHEAFKTWVDQGYQVISPSLTSHHSGNYSTALSVAQAFGGRVTVVDSLALSWGFGWQVINAARMALQGATKEEILARIMSLRSRTHHIYMIDSLEYLRRGGRAAKVMPTIDRLARALNLKPIMNLPDGEAKLLGIARSYQKGVERIKEEILRLAPLEKLFVMHTRRPEIAQQLAGELAQVTHIPREEICVGEIGAVVACHTGEGLMAALAVSAA